MTKLGDICTFQSGGTPSKANKKYYGGCIPWITTVALNSSMINESNSVEWITKQAIEESAAKIVPANSIMVGTRVGVGKVAINTVPMSTSQDIVSLIEIDEDHWNKKYICKFILSKSNYLNSQARGATIKGIRIDTLADLHLPKVTLDEQDKTVNVLDVVDNLITLRKQQLVKLNELVKARFVEMFGDITQNKKGWEQYTFSDIATSRLGKMLDAKQQTGKYAYPYLANFNVQWFRFEIENLNKMDFNEADRQEFELREGDLLVCEGGEIGRCAVWHNEIQPCYFQKALHRVRCNQYIVLPDYMAWWFKYNCDHKGFAAIEGAKATIAHLPGAKLKALKVTVPPIELQKQFVAFLKQIDKSKSAVQQSLDKLETLKKALMQKYFG